MGRTKAATPAGRTRTTTRRSGAQSKATAKPKPKTARSGAATRAKPKSKTKAKPKAARRSTKRAPAKTARGDAGRKPARRTRTTRSKPARRRRPAAAPRARRPFSWRSRLILGIVLLAALGCGYLFWLRDSSLVAVDNVRVTGVTAGDTEQVVGALESEAETMTTLHVRAERIERVAATFPTVASVDVDTSFPHSMTITVHERPPALIVKTPDEEVPVAADGTILTGVEAPKDGGDLPLLTVSELPDGPLLAGDDLSQARVLGAAPEPLRPLIDAVEVTKDYGVVVTLNGEIPVRFGSSASAPAKWAAAAAVLADSRLTALTYLDVRLPQRPAAGGNG